MDRTQAIGAAAPVLAKGWPEVIPADDPTILLLTAQMVDAFLAVAQEAEFHEETASEMCGIIRRITDEAGAAAIPFLDDAVSYALQLARELSPQVTDEMATAAFARLSMSQGEEIGVEDVRAALEAALSSDDGGGAGAARR